MMMMMTMMTNAPVVAANSGRCQDVVVRDDTR